MQQQKERMDCFVALLPCANASRLSQAMTERQTSAFSRRDAPEVCINFRPCDNRGRRESRVPMHPQPRVQCRKHTSVVTTGSPETIPAFPAQWFYGFLRALPGDRACLPPSSCAFFPQDLIPASGCQDHTTSPYASVPFVQRAIRAPDTSASTASRTNVRDDREAPLLRDRMA
jgi:hypothetical protein